MAQGTAQANQKFVGNDRLLFGMIFGVLAFWLFAQTTLNIGPTMASDLGIEMSVMNIAISITALFSGIFIVVVGGLADRIGRVKTVQMGFILSIAGSLIIGLTPSGGAADLMMMAGRILQGLSGAFIMPASLALVKAYWDGAERQRAISWWSIGSWGGSGFAALFGGFMAESIGWRWIFFAAVAISILGMVMVAGTPESKAETTGDYKFDIAGVLAFMVMMVSLQVALTQGGAFGWTSPITLGLIVLAIVFAVIFFKLEQRNPNAFVDFKLFRNMTFTGATLSNFLLNATAGIIVIAMSLMQLGAELTAQEAGYLTIGYGVVIVAFIRTGEKLLQKFGPRKPMLWGSLIVGVSIALLMQTYTTDDTYKIIAFIAFSLFGLGLAFYATPSTDAALSSLPEDQSGSGSGIYKMASSLGASFGVAISATVFTLLNSDAGDSFMTDGLISWVGRQDNIVTREAAMVAFGVNLVILAIAILSILTTIPKGGGSENDAA